MIDKAKTWLKQLKCQHFFIRRKINHKKYRYEEKCSKCSYKRYVK